PSTPLAFCFVLRSMFELSAKAYYQDHPSAGLPSRDSKGNELKLAELLREIAKHLIKTAPAADQPQDKKHLHGATCALRMPNRFLTVTTMNKLLQHSSLLVAPQVIVIIFHNVFPLLESMNA